MTPEQARMLVDSLAANIEKVGRESLRVLAERDALRAALRKRVVVIDPMCWKDDAKICELCHGEWAHPGPERHAPGCLAAPDAARALLAEDAPK